MVSEFEEFGIAFGKKFAICIIGVFTSTIAHDAITCTVANFENLSTHVRKRVPSVEKMSMWRISPTEVGIGFCATACLDGWRLYFAMEQILQFDATSVASRNIFRKK